MAGERPAAKDAANAPPVIESVTLVPERPVAHQQLRAEVAASDEDGDAIELGYAWSIGGRPLDAGGPEITLPDLRKGDSVELTVTVSDGKAEGAPATARVLVGNQPPELVAVSLRPEGDVNRGKPLTAVPAASDPDGDGLSFDYTWTVNGTKSDERGDTLDTTKLKRGDTVRVRVVANDGESDSNAIESPELKVANASPVIRSTPPPFEGDGTYRYPLEVTDPDGDRTLRFRLAHAPDGMTIDAVSGVIQWKPTAQSTGKHTVEVVVDDLQGGSTNQIFELTVALKDVPPEGAVKTTSKDAASPSGPKGTNGAKVANGPKATSGTKLAPPASKAGAGDDDESATEPSDEGADADE